MTQVLFVRLSITSAKTITTKLNELYKDHWRVVQYSESRDEYSFVMEREVPDGRRAEVTSSR